MNRMKLLLLALCIMWPCTARAADATLSSATCPGTGCQTTTVTGYGTVAVQISGTFSGILVFEASVDGTNFVGIVLPSVGGVGGAASTQAPGMWSGSVHGLTSFRVRFASYVSGSASVSTLVAVNTTATVISQASGWSFGNVTTNTTSTLKTGAGVLHCVTVNILGTTSQVVLYDNTAGSGTKIGTVTTLIAGQTGCYDAAFATGLTIVTTGALAADITVSYR